MKVLITGASGLLGSRLFEMLSKTYETAGTYFGKKVDNLNYLDISDRKSVESFIEKIRPDVIIHTAALVDADYCEKNKDEALLVNVEGTRNIVDACRKYDCKLIYLSSDYVFDGKEGAYNEESVPHPLNYYGTTKLEGERIVKENLERYIIIRPAILYGDDSLKPAFISQILSKLAKGEKISLDNKIVKYPTLTDDLGEAIKKLIELDAFGTYHISGEDPVTRYQWALKIAEIYGFPKELISSDGIPGKAKRPMNVRLDNSKIKKLGIHLSAEKVDRGLEIVRNQMGCIFKMIYSARPDMLVLNQSASTFRVKIGEALAKEHPAKADIVIPVPESGIYAATGYSAESKIPFYFGLIRDYFTNKTLFEPTLQMRTASLDKKLIVVPEIVKNKRVVLIDEAIVAGTTLAIVVEKLKKAGAKEIHIRIPAPPMPYNCRNRVLKEDAQLIARGFGSKKEDIEEGLRNHFGVDSLRFLSLEGFLNCLNTRKNVCFECFKNLEDVRIIRTGEVPDESRNNGKYSIKRLFTESLSADAKNVGFYQTTIPPRSSVSNHYHKNLDEILYFLTKAKVRVGSEIHVLNPGDIMFLPIKSPHEIISEDKEVKLIAVKLPNIVDDKVNVNSTKV